MRFDGMDFRQTRKFGFREAQEGDLDSSDKPVKPGHIVIVNIDDCKIEEENGRQYYIAKGVKQCVKLGYGLTNMGYGPWEYHKVVDGYKVVPGLGVLNPGDQWKSCRVYLVKNARVYTTTLKQRVSLEERVETAAKAVKDAWQNYCYGGNNPGDSAKAKIAMDKAVANLLNTTT